MFDFKFDWNNDCMIGINELDEQHKELFRIGRSIEQLIITGCIGVTHERLYEIVRELREYASYHFYEEEKLMDQYNYSESAFHKAEHDRFIKYIESINIPQLGDNPKQSLKILKEDIQTYIFQHILNEDRKLATEIQPNIIH